jgi:hypothetical protein
MSTLERFVTRNGKRIAIVTQPPRQAANRAKKRRAFKSRFVQVPIYWVEQLAQCDSAATYQLALRILLEHHKRRRLGDYEIILSTQVTGLPRQIRSWATKKMVEAKMIEISQAGNQAVRVVKLLHMHSNSRSDGK